MARGLFLALALAAFALVSASFVAGCSNDSLTPAHDGDRLVAGRILGVDLDGDGAVESVTLGDSGASLLIRDGETSYRSRAKWQLREAYLTDCDGDGVREVTALLADSDGGRHLGVFGWVNGRYGERMVSARLTPTPLSLRILPGISGASAEATAAGASAQASTGGDLLVLTEQTSRGGAALETVYRWNGFGFTAMAPAGS